jgi:hypothetical protein
MTRGWHFFGSVLLLEVILGDGVSRKWMKRAGVDPDSIAMVLKKMGEVAY